MRSWMWVCVLVAVWGLFACGDEKKSGEPSSDGDATELEAVADGDELELEAAADGDEVELEAESESELEEEAEAEPDLVAQLYEGLVPASAITVHETIGVATHMDQNTGENAERNFELDTYEQLGGARIREDFAWASIEPAEGEWHFEGLDVQVALAKEHGVKMTALLDYGVGWAMSDGTPETLDPATFAAFAGKVAERYCADIKHYEVWNEQNTARFWAPKPNPVTYGALLKASHTAIKAACPDSLVVFGGLCSMAVDSRMGERWWFLDEMAVAHPDICASFDVLGIHPYTYAQAASPEQDYELSKTKPMQSQPVMTAMAREKLGTLGCAAKPIWFTEMGWPSYDLTEETVARFLSRSLLLSMKDDVQGYYWYDFADGEPITSGSRPHENYFGLFGWPGDVTNPHRAKPAFHAFKGLNDLLGASYFARDLSGPLALPADVYALAFVDEAGLVTLALWDGRENPDGKLGDGKPNVPDTSFALVLPLPAWAQEVIRYDQDATKLETVAVAGSLDVTLNAKVQFIVLGKSAPLAAR